VTAALQRANQVALALAVVAAIAVAAGGFASVAPNRLLSGKPVMLWQAAGAPASTAVVALVAALAAGAFARWRGIGAILGAALLLAVLYAAGDMADRLKGVVSLGAAFWTLLGAAALAVVDGMQRSRAGPLAMLGTAVAILAAAALMAAAGWFDGLSLAREFHTRHDVFGPAVLRHIELVVGSVVPAIAIGVPLGLGTVRHPNWRGPIFATLNLLQTIPSIALFGLLIAPLTALGIGGVGPAPALIALVLYALLPVARSTAAGLGGIDPAVADAARGMGMTERQILWRVEIPLAAPVLLAGLRIVTVQTIGLAVVAALIGAGGLGSFVFAGLGQDAADLVLLGALPAIFLALAADFLLRLAAGR